MKTGSYYSVPGRVQLTDLVSTLQHHAITASNRMEQDGEVPRTPNHLQGTAVLCFIMSSIDLMGVSISIQLTGTRS